MDECTKRVRNNMVPPFVPYNVNKIQQFSCKEQLFIYCKTANSDNAGCLKMKVCHRFNDSRTDINSIDVLDADTDNETGESIIRSHRLFVSIVEAQKETVAVTFCQSVAKIAPRFV